MKLVIEIPEEVYEEIKAKALVSISIQIHTSILAGALIAIKDGTPLPKKHGRLIDADKLSQDDEVTEWVSRDAIRTGKQLKMFSELFLKKIKDAPTVVEADKDGD